MHVRMKGTLSGIAILMASVAVAACQTTEQTASQIAVESDPRLDFSRSEAGLIVRQGDAIEVTVQMAYHDETTCEVNGPAPTFAEFVEDHPESQPINGSILDGGTRIHVNTRSNCATDARRVLFTPDEGYEGPAYFVVEWNEDNMTERKIWVFAQMPGTRITGQQIAESHVGPTLSHADGYEIVLDADGTFEANRGRFPTGSWQIEDDQLCMSYADRYNGCYEITIDENGTFHRYSPDRGWGSVEIGYTLVPRAVT